MGTMLHVRDWSVNMVSSDDKHQCDKPVVVLLLNNEQYLGYIFYMYQYVGEHIHSICLVLCWVTLKSPLLFHVMIWNDLYNHNSCKIFIFICNFDMFHTHIL